MKKIWDRKMIPTLLSFGSFLAALMMGLPWLINRLYYRHDRTLDTTKYLYLGYAAFFLVFVGILIPVFRKVWLYLRISKRSPLDGLATIAIAILSSVPLLVLTVSTIVILKKDWINRYKTFHFSVTVTVILLGAWVRYHGENDKKAPIKIANHTSWWDYLLIVLTVGIRPFNVVAGINLRKKKPTILDKLIAMSIGKIVEDYSISIDRDDPNSKFAVALKIVSEIKAGKDVGIFVEGTRTLKKDILKGVLLQKFHRGIFRIAWENKISIQPIVFDWPVMLRGKGDDWWGMKPGSIDCYYLPSFDPRDYETAEALMNACWQAMYDQLANSKKVQRFLKQS